MFSITQSNRDTGCAVRSCPELQLSTAGITHLPPIKLHGPNKTSCHRLGAKMVTNRCKKVIKASSGRGYEETQGKEREWEQSVLIFKIWLCLTLRHRSHTVPVWALPGKHGMCPTRGFSLSCDAYPHVYLELWIPSPLLGCFIGNS